METLYYNIHTSTNTQRIIHNANEKNMHSRLNVETVTIAPSAPTSSTMSLYTGVF